jgi:hypothetical protein
VSREIIKKKTGTVTVFAFDKEGLSEHTAFLDALVHVRDGVAEITIGGTSHGVGKESSVLRSRMCAAACAAAACGALSYRAWQCTELRKRHDCRRSSDETGQYLCAQLGVRRHESAAFYAHPTPPRRGLSIRIVSSSVEGDARMRCRGSTAPQLGGRPT